MKCRGVTLNVVFTSAKYVDCLLGTLEAGEEEGRRQGKPGLASVSREQENGEQP